MSHVLRAFLILFAVLIAAGVLGIGIARRLIAPHANDASVTAVAPLVAGHGVTLRFSDKPLALPAFDLQDLEGRPVSPRTLAGKVVLLNFWATWCGPCRAEIPMLVALQRHYADHLVVVGLSIDEGGPALVQQFATQYAVTYPIAIVGPDVQAAFGGIRSVPATFVVNRDGQIVQRHIGLLDPAVTEHEVRSLAGLPTDATVEIVKDVGQVLLGNAAFATEIPGIDLARLTSAQREQVRHRLNTDLCACGCGLTLAQCRINDPSCEVSLPVAKRVVEDVRRTLR